MPSNTYGEAGAGGGASGSVDFGQATSLRDQMQKATAGTQGPTGEPARPEGGGSAPPPQQGGEGQPGPAAQPPPGADPQADGQQPFNIENYPMQQRSAPALPWREQLKIWGAHPQANDALRRLARLANPEQNG